MTAITEAEGNFEIEAKIGDVLTTSLLVTKMRK